MRFRQALLLLSVLAAAAAAHAETRYVIEQVVVNVSSTPDATGERVATIKSGDAVEVLDTQGDQVHVHLTNGMEGWVRKFVPRDRGATARAAERTHRRSREAQAECDTAGGELAAAKDVNTPAAAPVAQEPAATEQQAHEPPYFMTPPDSPHDPCGIGPWGSFVVALGLGFVLGWQMLDRRIRRKYGGLRIY